MYVCVSIYININIYLASIQDIVTSIQCKSICDFFHPELYRSNAVILSLLSQPCLTSKALNLKRRALCHYPKPLSPKP